MYALLLLNHNTSKSNFCVKLLSCKRNFFSQNFFGATPPGTPLKWGPKKSMFWTAQARVLVCFDITRYLTDKYFDIIWRCHLPRDPPNGPPKNQFFEWLKLGWQFCFDISRYLTDKYFHITWGCHPSGDSFKWPPKKSILCTAQLRVPSFYDISRNWTDKYFGVVWGYHPPGSPKWTPKINFLNGPS